MPVAGAVIGAAGSIGGGLLSAGATKSAAKSAAAAQAAADRAAIAEQRRQYNLTRSDLQPWMGAGEKALQNELALLGLGGHGAREGTVNWGNYVDATPEALKMFQQPGGAGGLIQGLGGTGYTGAPTDKNAFGEWYYNKYGNDADLGAYTTGGSPAVTNWEAQQRALGILKDSPLYKTLMANGQNTMLQNASATGGLRGGNFQRALADFGRDTFAGVYQDRLSQLQALSGQGQNAAAQTGTFGANSANSISELLSNSGAARANAYLAAGNAQAGAYGDIASALGALGANKDVQAALGKIF